MGRTYHHGVDEPSFVCHRDGNTRMTSDQSDLEADNQGRQQLYND